MSSSNPFLAAIFVSAWRELRQARDYQDLANEYSTLTTDAGRAMHRRALDARDHFVRRAMAYRHNARALRARFAELAGADTMPPQVSP